MKKARPPADAPPDATPAGPVAAAAEGPGGADGPPAAPTPTLRLHRIVAAVHAALANPDEQEGFCGNSRPAKENFAVSVGSDDWPPDVVARAVVARAAAAVAPLDALRTELRDGAPFRQARQLRERMRDAEAGAAQAKAAAEESLASAALALEQGRDPAEAEGAYRNHQLDIETFVNRAAALRKLLAAAEVEAQAGVEAALANEFERLQAAAAEEDEAATRELCQALSQVLPRAIAAKGARAALAEHRRHLFLAKTLEAGRAAAPPEVLRPPGAGGPPGV